MTSQNAFTRTDTSICPHLLELITEGANGVLAVKDEPEDPGQESQVAGDLAQSTGGKKSEVEKRFTDVIRWGAREEGVKRRKVSSPKCQACETTLHRPWACLTCPFIGCMSLSASSSQTNECMAGHWASSNNACSFAVDPTSGAIFCSQCNDTTYPDTFDTLFRTIRLRVEEENDRSREQTSLKRGRGAWRPWTVPHKEYSDMTKSSCRGLRPLLNLSQTCFLSAILQCLIHNPLLKAYFLSEKHNRHVCHNGSKGLGVGKPYLGPERGQPTADREKGCMCCEMDRAFEEFHGEDKAPFGPITMLYSMWHASAELEGYGQQDAHSFFLAALDQMHAHAKGQLSSCNCIAHQTFAGSLLSAVTCSSCRTTSTTIDPILDIQLDFPTDTSNADSLTLISMLRRFCAEERVGDHGKGYECSSCGGGTGVVALRKLLIKKLPPVLSFQLKRFAHNATSTKVELPVRFPSYLNMAPYVEAEAPDPPEQEAGEDGPTFPSTSATATLPSSLYAYDLFAVVTHEGKLDNGHYWADVLSGDEWWHCDDDKVTPTTLKEVLGQKAYMLFYVKRSLSYAQPLSRFLPGSGAQNGVTNGNGNGHPNGLTNGSNSGGDDRSHAVNGPSGQNPSGGRIGHPIGGMAV